jgi:hypothetical protein
MEKIYNVRICFGDGKPLETVIKAKSGINAQDKAIKDHPGARNVHILSVKQVEKQEQPKQAPAEFIAPVVDDKLHPLFTDVTHEQVKRYINKDKLHRMNQIQSAIELKKNGVAHRRIAALLGVGSTTVGTWLKQYGSD